MSRMAWVATQLVLLLWVVGCQTVPNISPSPILVPSSLTDHDVELAILMAVADRAVAPTVPPGQRITDNRLSDIVAINVVMVPTQNRSRRSTYEWYFEDHDPRTVYAGFQHRKFYMRVAVRHDAHQVTMAIVDSHNLKQDEGSIHKKAFVYLQDLGTRERRALGTLARRQVAEPTSP
jgi:hypothetical protein